MHKVDNSVHVGETMVLTHHVHSINLGYFHLNDACFVALCQNISYRSCIGDYKYIFTVCGACKSDIVMLIYLPRMCIVIVIHVCSKNGCEGEQ